MHYSELYHNRDANAVPDVGDFVFHRGRMHRVIFEWEWETWAWGRQVHVQRSDDWIVQLWGQRWIKESGIFYLVNE